MKNSRHGLAFPPTAACVATVLTLLGPSGAAAQDAAPTIVFAPESQPGADDFDATLLVIRADPQLDFWSKTLTGSVPSVGLVERVFQNELFMPLVIMRHIGDMGRGTGHVTMDVSILGADGETDEIGGDLTAFSGPLPPANVVTMSEAVFSVALDSEETPGSIKLMVKVHDHGSDRTVQLVADLELAAWIYGESPADKQEFRKWTSTYHTMPHPAEAVRAYLEFADLQDANARLVALQLFATIFGSNAWLLPHLVGRFPVSTPEQRVKIVALLHATDRDDLVAALPFADDAERRAIDERLPLLELPDPYGPLVSPGQLDLLWAEFLASGRYRPVRQIVEALTLAPFEKALSKEKPPRTEKEREAAMKSAIFQAARWSLDSNMKQHALVRNYVLFMLENEPLGEAETTVLKALAAKHAGGGAPSAQR